MLTTVLPMSWLRNFDAIQLEQTCHACPELYDAFLVVGRLTTSGCVTTTLLGMSRQSDRAAGFGVQTD